MCNKLYSQPCIYMSSREYLQITPEQNKIYWVLGEDGSYGVYKNDVLIDGSEVRFWQLIQNKVRTGTFSQYYSIGDQFTIPWNNTDLLWDVVAIDVACPADPTKTHSVTLMPHGLISYKIDFEFDSSEPTNPNVCSDIDNRDSISGRKYYGNNRYSHSAIRQWLNSAADVGSWWHAQHEYDSPPSYANRMDGFMKGIPSGFLSVVGDTKIKVALNKVTDGGGYEDIIDKFYLPSTTEVGVDDDCTLKADKPAEGSLFPYFTSKEKRMKAGRHKNVTEWMLRTPSIDFTTSEYVIWKGGSLSYRYSCTGAGVCPACNII